MTTFVASGAGAFFGSYLKKKGENLATHEDIDKLVHQVTVVTKATKSIEETISDDSWGKQRRWELYRDVLLDAVETVSKFQGETNKLIAMSLLATRLPQPNEKLDESLKSIGQSLVEQTPRLMTISYRVALVSDRNIQKTLTAIQQMLLTCGELVRNQQFAEVNHWHSKLNKGC